MKRKSIITMLASLLILSLTLSSCGLLGGGSKANEELEGSVVSYFRSIANGRLAGNDFESDYAEDTPFAELSFSEDSAKFLMIDGMERMEFDIEEVKADSRKNEGFCDVIISAIDVDTILSELGDAYSEEDFIDIFESEDVPMKDYDVTLDLFYDDRDELWIIEDTSEIVDILGKPYTKISFSATGPRGIADEFVKALAHSDFDKIEKLSDYMLTSEDFVDSSIEGVDDLFATVFGDMTFEFLFDDVAEDYAEYTYTLKVKDYLNALEVISSDMDNMVQLMGELIYTNLVEGDSDQAYNQYLSYVVAQAIDIMQFEDNDLVLSLSVRLSYDSSRDQWYIDEYSYSYEYFSNIDYRFNPLIALYDSESMQIAKAALDNMLSSGRIDQTQYNRGLILYTDEEIVTEYTIDEINSQLIGAIWYDFYTYSYVEEYSMQPFSLNVDLEFENTMPGLKLYCDFFVDDGQVLIGTVEYVMNHTFSYAEFILDHPEDDLFGSGTYSAVIYMEDGTVISESSIEVLQSSV